jgi:Glycosyltransferase family 9 (heptosyltransferase)
MKNPTPTDIWFFVGHSIGVTLLGIHALEAAYFGLPARERGKLYMVINGDKRGLYDDMIAQYPHITLVTISRRSAFTLLKTWIATFGRRQIVLHPLSFGKVNRIHALLTWLITLPQRHSRSVVFGERTIANRFFFTTILPRNLEQSIFISARDAITTTGITPVSFTPQLLFEVAEPLPIFSGRQYIVVHPFASSVSRSLTTARWQELFDWLTVSYSHHSIVISGGPADRTAATALIRSTYTNVYFSQDIISSFVASFSLTSRAALYVGVDTGPTHIAAHVGVPTIVIGNNSNPCWLPYYNPKVTVLMNLSVCTCQGDKTGGCYEYEDGVKYYRCLYTIPQEEIKASIKQKI